MLFRWTSSFKEFHCSSMCRSLSLVAMKYRRLLYMRAAVPVERNNVSETPVHAVLMCVSVLHVTDRADDISSSLTSHECCWEILRSLTKLRRATVKRVPSFILQFCRPGVFSWRTGGRGNWSRESSFSYICFHEIFDASAWTSVPRWQERLIERHISLFFFWLFIKLKLISTNVLFMLWPTIAAIYMCYATM